MTVRNVLRRLALLVSALAVTQLAVTAPASADPIQYRYSTGNRFAIYVQPLTDSAGAEVGIRVYYSVGALADRPGYSAHFVGVCFSPSVYACYNTGSRAWGYTASGSIGSWRWQDITLNCAANASMQVEVLQPYLSRAGLNFQPFDSPPYQNGQYFYWGNTDSAYLQVIGGHQVWT
jgi:hypothetical protein